MPLRACVACDAKISASAPMCPHCGHVYTTKAAGKYLAISGLVGLLLLFPVLIVIASTSANAMTRDAAAAGITVLIVVALFSYAGWLVFRKH